MPRRRFKYHAVDFIPRKRHEEEILNELDKERRKPAVAYGQRGKDRNKMIEELQEIHRFGDKKVMDDALKKEREARERALKAGPIEMDNRMRLKAKYNMNIAQNAMKHYEEKFGQNPAKFLLS